MTMKRDIYELPENTGPTTDGYRIVMRRAIQEAVDAAIQSPCAKSKRGAAAFPFVVTAGLAMRVIARHNRPPAPFECAGDAVCRAVCGQICNHAEARAVTEWINLRSDACDVLHIEVVDGEPVPFDRPGKPLGPSCITCARDMLGAFPRVRLVWLWGVDGWRWWEVEAFYRDTVCQLALVPFDHPLRARPVR